MSKGSKRRPQQVSEEILADRWAKTFGGTVGVGRSDRPYWEDVRAFWTAARAVGMQEPDAADELAEELF